MYQAFKRLFDIVASGIAILLLLPFALPVMLLLRLTGEGKIFYRQERLGYKNQKFSILKFATMLEDSLNMPGGEITLDKDPRITPMGGILRKTKINELPQLWNVFVGDMSIVGPRPLMRVSFDMYSPEVQEIVYESRPGLTGIGSLVFRDEAGLVKASGEDPRAYYRNVIYPHKGALESWYFKNRSTWTDIKIIILTAVSILFPGSSFASSAFQGLPELDARLNESPTPVQEGD
ncbi:MAG: sugar transferase [Burkholderiaceae bacterium]